MFFFTALLKGGGLLVLENVAQLLAAARLTDGDLDALTA